MREYEKVTETFEPGPIGGTIYKHPCFGQIRASRVSGHTTLYNSDFAHQHYLTVTISKSELRRDLSNDWLHEDGELIEVALSESQWANFVSSMNSGSGTPCTIQHLNGKMVPQLEEPVDRKSQFAAEHDDHLKDAINRCKDLTSVIEKMGLPKGKTKELLDGLSGIQAQIDGNLNFVADQFEEHMEKVTDDAKSEIYGHMLNVINRAGLKALGAENMPLAIEASRKEIE